MFIPPSINHVQTQNHRPDRIRSVRLSGFPICPKHLITPSRFSDYAVKLFNTRPATDKTIFPIRQPVGRAAPRLPDGRSQSRTGTPPRKQIHRKPQLFRQGRQPEPTLYVPYRQRSQKTQYARRSRPASLHRKRVRHQSQITRRRIGPVAVHARYRQALRLGKTPVYDGRHDVYAATDAALNYLQYLYGLFGDWPLAFAAYNWGEGNVGRAVNRARDQGLEPTYENLRMPNETRNYVPKLLAVRNIIATPQSFGMNISDIDNKPYFQAVEPGRPLDNEAIARLAGITQSELLALNPAFNVPAFIPKNKRKLLLPVASVQTFQSNYLNAAPDSLFSWEVYTPAAKTSLSDISTATGMSIADIKRLNNLNGNLVNAGRSILVAKNGKTLHTASESVVSIDIDNTPDTYRSNMPAGTVNVSIARIQPAAAQTADITVAPLPQETVRTEPDPLVRIAEPALATAAAQPQTEKQTAMPSETQTATLAQVVPPNDMQAADELMQLVARNNLRRQAEETISAVIGTPDTVAEHNISSSPQHTVAADGKRRARLETRVAKAADGEAETSPLHASIHRVVEGDTLFNIAKRYNVSVADLIVANNIKGNTIQKGQVLRLAQAAPAQTRIEKVSYTARKGDTFKSIAARFNIHIDDIRRLNPNLNTINPGQRVKLIGS